VILAELMFGISDAVEIFRGMFLFCTCLWSSEHRVEDVYKALKMISQKTCVGFHPRTNETDYLHFELSNG